MKKLFLMLAFTGIVGAASATSIASLTKASVITLGTDDKKTDDKKKEEKKSCDKDKACCKKDAKGNATATADGKEGKSCCKAKHAEATAAPATSEKK